jgi:26S proteasome regulatory subunit N3
MKADQKPDAAKPVEEKNEEQVKPPPLTAAAEIKANISFIERAVTTLEPRFTHRVLRTLTALKKRLDDAALREAIVEVYPRGGSGMSLCPRANI